MTKGISNPVVNGNKWCPQCGITKPVSEFYSDKKNPDGVRSPCKQCCKEEGKERYAQEGSAGKTSNTLFVQRRLKLKHELVDTAGGCCTRCGYNKSIYALDFHHIGKDKEGRIAEMISVAASNGKSISALQLEAAKCILLCSNCHRELHAGEWKL